MEMNEFMLSAGTIEEQVFAMACELKYDETRTYIDETASKIFIIERTDEFKVKALRETSLVAVKLLYIEEKNILAVCLEPAEASDRYSLYGALPLGEEKYFNLLLDISQNRGMMEFIAVSQDLNIMSRKQILTNLVSRQDLFNKLKYAKSLK